MSELRAQTLPNGIKNQLNQHLAINPFIRIKNLLGFKYLKNY